MCSLDFFDFFFADFLVGFEDFFETFLADFLANFELFWPDLDSFFAADELRRLRDLDILGQLSEFIFFNISNFNDYFAWIMNCGGSETQVGHRCWAQEKIFAVFKLSEQKNLELICLHIRLALAAGELDAVY